MTASLGSFLCSPHSNVPLCVPGMFVGLRGILFVIVVLSMFQVAL